MPLSKLSPGEQADFFRLVLDSTVEGVCTMDREGRVTMCNAAFMRMFGFSEEDKVISSSLHDRIHHHHADGSLYPISECPLYLSSLSGEGCHVPEDIFFRKDGSAFPVEYRVQPLKRDMEIKGVICTFVDISDRVAQAENLAAAQRAAESASERINLALDSGTVLGTWVWDIPNDRVFGDERFARTFSVRETDAHDGLTFDMTIKAMHPEDVAHLREAVLGALSEGGPFRSEYRLRNGDDWRWVEASGTVERDATGRPVRFPGVLIDIDERKCIEHALKESNEKLRLAQNAGGVIGTWFWDLPQQKVTGDAGFARTFGIEPEALAKGVAFDLIGAAVHPEDIPGMVAAVEKTMSSGEACIIDYRVKSGDGWRWVNATGKAELDAEGRAINQSGIVIDIDERRRTELALDESHHQLKMAQKVGGIGVFALPANADELVVSEEFCTIFGLEPSPVVSLAETACLVLPEDSPAQSTEDDRAEGTTPSETEYRIRRPSDGEIRWIYRRAEFIRDAEGKASHMVGMVQDITERKMADLRLKESRAYLNLMLESVQDYAIISLDEAGRIVLWNSGAQKTFGYRPQDVMGSHIEVIFTPEDRAHGAPRTELALAATNTRASDERWHLRQNGERFYASGTMAAMYDDEGRVKGFIKIARDMTAQQQAQEALLEARNAAEAANIAKTEFLANMSHEIRTPMNAIIGLSTILSKSQPLTPRQNDYIRTLSMSADSLLALINDLLDIAKIEARTVELEHIPFSLTRLMQEVASMMAVSVRDKGLTFTGDGECVEERMFIGDPTRLRQIIVNLCSNAIKFTESGGVHVAITCEAGGAPDIERIRLTVTDTGIGIAPEKMETIFQKFVQADTSINRKYGGTGLGLAITKTLTEIMGGDISVKSEIGRGSVFEVCIPLKIATNDQVARTEYSIHAITSSTVEVHVRPYVLLVEDYEPNVLVATAFLEDFGYQVDVANNGLEAFDAVKARSYLAVLMDVQMHGMNGLDATRRIREWEMAESRPRTRIIGMTAHALAGDRERCLGVGMDDYIPKPFRPEELRRKIEQGLLV
jgi:PAS domain S-box-containing protein